MCFNLALLGNDAVGKSSFLMRFLDGMFGSTLATLGIHQSDIQTVELDGEKIRLCLFDTNGLVASDSLNVSTLSKISSGILIVYDVLSQDGLEQVQRRFLPLIEMHCKSEVVRMLIANKCDVAKANRKISTEAGRRFAIEHGMRFMEVSAKSGMNVHRAVVTIAREILTFKCEPPVLPKQREFLTSCEVGDFASITWETLDELCDPRTVNTQFDHCTPLHYACLHGNLSAVKLLVEEYKCDASCEDHFGETPLHWAIENRHMDIVKYLINERHCNPNDKNKHHLNSLQIACKAGCLHVVKYLISGRLCNPTDQGNDCLQIACKHNQTDVIDYLVSEVHLDPAQKDASGQSCLHLAYYSGLSAYHNHDTVMYLISLPQCDVKEMDTSGGTCLHWASQHGLLNIVKYLVSERKCDPYVKNGLGQNCQQIALHGTGGMFSKKEETVKYLSEPCSSSARDIQRCWLHWACRTGYVNLVKYFIHDLHYNPNDKEPNVEQNCFHVACTMGHTTVVEFLMSDTQCNIQEKDWCQMNGFHLACYSGHIDTVKLLRRTSQFDLNERDKDGHTCLHLAYTSYRRYSSIDVLRYLIALPHCVVHEPNKNGESCLHWACRTGQLDIVEYLITERHCDPNDNNGDKQNFLQISFEHNQLSIVEYLLNETKCDVQKNDRFGRTCLHWACEKGHLKVVQKLVTEKHCNPSSKNRDGLNCLHIACQTGSIMSITVDSSICVCT